MNEHLSTDYDPELNDTDADAAQLEEIRLRLISRTGGDSNYESDVEFLFKLLKICPHCGLSQG